MNKSNGNLKKDRYTLIFQGGPLDGKSKQYPYLPLPGYGFRSPKTAEGQVWYKIESHDEATGKVVMVMG